MPVYNEAASISSVVSEVGRNFVDGRPNTEVHIFEDGSTDGTPILLERLSRQHSWLFVHSSPKRKGYPGAARDAITWTRHSSAEVVLFVDSDGQYDPSDFSLLIRRYEAGGVEIVSGYRSSRVESIHRKVLSAGLKVIFRLFFTSQTSDITSALRVMHKDAACDLAEQVRYSRFNFWVEFSARQSRSCFRACEIPVHYRPRAGVSQVYSLRKMPHVVFSEFIALLETRRELG